MISRKANRKSEIGVGANKWRGGGGEGGLRLREIIEDNFLGLWPRLVLPCPLNFHVRGCGHLAVYMLAYSPCICKAPSVVSRDG